MLTDIAALTDIPPVTRILASDLVLDDTIMVSGEWRYIDYLRYPIERVIVGLIPAGVIEFRWDDWVQVYR